MMKKIVALFLTTTIIVTCFCSPVSAEAYVSRTDKTSMINETFWETAEVQIQNDVVILSKTTLLELGQTQAVSYGLHNGQGTVSESYVNEIALIVPKEGYTAEDVYSELYGKYDSAATRATGNKTESDHDSSISIEATLTIYYTRTISGDMTYVKLTKIEGGYTQQDRQVMVVSQIVERGCTGWAAGGVKTQTLNMVDYGDTTSWSEDMPSSWVPVADNGYSIFAVGANVTFTLRRKSSSNYTWTLNLHNNL